MNKIKVKSNISSRILGQSNLSKYSGKLNELVDIAKDIAPEGGIYVTLVDKGDVFSPVNKTIRGLLDLERIYSHRALQSNPELSEEFTEIAKAMKTIDSIINKRRQSQRKFKNNYKNKKEE